MNAARLITFLCVSGLSLGALVSSADLHRSFSLFAALSIVLAIFVMMILFLINLKLPRFSECSSQTSLHILLYILSKHGPEIGRLSCKPSAKIPIVILPWVRKTGLVYQCQWNSSISENLNTFLMPNSGAWLSPQV